MSAERREALARVLWEAFDRPVYGLKAEWCQIATDTVFAWLDQHPTDDGLRVVQCPNGCRCPHQVDAHDLARPAADRDEARGGES